MAIPINIKTTNLELTNDLSVQVDKKIGSLERLINEKETDVICDVEIAKMPEHQTGPVHRAEINLQVSGRMYRAEAVSDSVQNALEAARDDMKRELTKHKTKQESLVRRGGKRFKEMLQRWR